MRNFKKIIIFGMIFVLLGSTSVVEARKSTRNDKKRPSTIVTAPVEAAPVEEAPPSSLPKGTIDVTTVGIANDGSDITNKLNSLPSGKYYFPAGNYGVNGFDLENDIWQGFRPKSNSTYIFEENAIIKVLTNGYAYYSGIFIFNVNNVTLINPTVEGDRVTHEFSGDSTHEWGHGILIIGKNTGTVLIENPHVYDVTGDGIDILSANSDITINNIKIERARRQGISVEDAGRLVVNGGTIKDISGTSPASGIDIEPYQTGQHLDNITFNNIVTQNTEQGLLLANLHMAENYNITFNNCTFDGIFVANIQKSTSGVVNINNPIINGSNMGIVWTNAHANVKLNNPIFNLTSLENEKVSEGIFRFYETNRINGDVIGGLQCTNAQILNNQSENKNTRIFNFVFSKQSTLSDMSISVTKSNVMNTIWVTNPEMIQNIFLSEPNYSSTAAILKAL